MMINNIRIKKILSRKTLFYLIIFLVIFGILANVFLFISSSVLTLYIHIFLDIIVYLSISIVVYMAYHTIKTYITPKSGKLLINEVKKLNLKNDNFKKVFDDFAQSKDFIKNGKKSQNQILDITSDLVDVAQSSFELLEEATTQINDGLIAISQLILTNKSLIKANKDLQGIETIIDKISTKTLMINDIVCKTQLLSVNASIEAARAGVHGKGFSVVAGEVKQLANVSGQSSIEIDELLVESGVKIKQLVNTITEKVEESHTVSINTQEHFIEISKGLNNITSNFKKIGMCTNEQELCIEKTIGLLAKIDNNINQISIVKNE